MGPRDKIDWIEMRIALVMDAIERCRREGTGYVTMSETDAASVVRTLKEYKARVEDDAYVPKTGKP